MLSKEYSNVAKLKEIFETETPKPNYRKLRGFAFDPSLSIQLETSAINMATFKIKWEDLEPGPIGEYLEVIDIDPASNLYYDGVNLNDPNILGQDGLPPSEGNPKFHQQMVYAVAMRTIENFEKALGRRALWSGRYDANTTEGDKEKFVAKLRIYPHALREANAFYSPQKKALLFGYFPASTRDVTQHMPDGIVFTCLSQDIIAHETTHALLDGMHRRFIEATHPDTLGFHEAFADIVALFQHFSMPEVLNHQIAKTKGDLTSQSLLGELAQQFGKAIGHYGALRSAIGKENPETKKWELSPPNPNDYIDILEPHARGAILVSAVFEAFISIYNIRVKDLFRIASGGSGLLPEGELHPTLVKLLALEASKAANHVLNMCIRALDYCPPVDINFGDYLRALITADAELVPDDDLDYRIAFIDAFKRRGIIPKGIKTLSVESLVFPLVKVGELRNKLNQISEFLINFQDEISRYQYTREDIYNITKKHKGQLHDLLADKLENSSEFSDLTGLLFKEEHLEKYLISIGDYGVPKFEVHSLRRARRVGPDGDALNQVIISITQKLNIKKKEWMPLLNSNESMQNNVIENSVEDDIIFRGGSTLIFDLDKHSLKYCINKPMVDPERLRAQVKYQKESTLGSLYSTYFTNSLAENNPEPLALLHRI
ncbi:hypothetical protein [Solitalea lacus]|uniref:hypothetical protein n=1 Tax=Solitalea lacus TaxID=2911172 RepID=UPI001EDACEB8|nr:hypothetical protein [Solitalea lacus]UKJ06191.1 hypothetical protein L2B55_11645 [Solitalea lacus]